jgi:hypothetical protein
MEFDELFVKATKNEGGGREPFPYQTCLAMGSHLPWLLHVPTGAGKTAAGPRVALSPALPSR